MLWVRTSCPNARLLAPGSTDHLDTVLRPTKHIQPGDNFTIFLSNRKIILAVSFILVYGSWSRHLGDDFIQVILRMFPDKYHLQSAPLPGPLCYQRLVWFVFVITWWIKWRVGDLYVCRRKQMRIVRRISQDKWWSWVLFPVLWLTPRLQQSAAHGTCLSTRKLANNKFPQDNSNKSKLTGQDRINLSI